MKILILALAVLAGIIFSLGLSVMGALATYEITYDRLKDNRREARLESLKDFCKNTFYYLFLFGVMIIFLDIFIL